MNEVLEHLYGLPEFSWREGGRFLWYSWPDGRLQGEVLASEVLMGHLPDGSRSELDASGLSYHKSLKEAQEHAICEIVERHLLGRMWFGQGEVFKIDSPVRLSEDMQVNFYRFSDTSIPMVLAVFESLSEQIWLCGSSVRTTVIKALSHALFEGLMLLDSILANDDGLCSNPRTGQRLASLRGQLSEFRSRHFASKVRFSSKTQSPDLSREFFVEEIVQRAFGRDVVCRSVVLREGSDGCVVRMLCDKALKIKELRKVYSDSSLPPDPFC